TLHPSPSTLHPPPFTFHPAPSTLHPSPFILHPAPCTLYPSPFILHYHFEALSEAQGCRHRAGCGALSTPIYLGSPICFPKSNAQTTAPFTLHPSPFTFHHTVPLRSSPAP
ncbi:hypothetical protein T484DRAFT_1625246, partial [Baffinella frigidus]